jgi:hypothetical protein
MPQGPDLVAKAVVSDYALGNHTASLGLALSKESRMERIEQAKEDWKSGRIATVPAKQSSFRFPNPRLDTIHTVRKNTRRTCKIGSRQPQTLSSSLAAP